MTDPQLKPLIAKAISELQKLNAEDPNELLVDGEPHKKEVLFAERLSVWVHKLEVTPSPALQVAAFGQHVERWKSLRTDYPEGRAGYLKWRKDLSKRHAEVTCRIAAEVGLPDEVVQAIRKINLKQNLRSNPETQVMEDALCLSFLEHEYVEFSAKHDDEKVIDIVQKTWGKMSEQGHAEALKLELSDKALAIVQKALSI